MPRAINLMGQVFGRLHVAGRAHKQNGGWCWHCVCDCGVKKTVRGNSLQTGATLSCGCLNREIKRNAAVHGNARKNAKRSREYTSWLMMLDRCRNPKNPGYPFYGGRGISVCERWTRFELFLADMGPRPLGTSLERENNEGNYEPGNCKWATRFEQNRNKRSTRLISFQGRTMCLQDWSTTLGIHFNTLSNRIDRGWPVERAFTEPVHTK